MNIDVLTKVCKRTIKAILPQKAIILYRRSRQAKIIAKNEKEYIKNVINDIFLKTSPNGEKYFDIHGILLPDIRSNTVYMDILPHVIEDSLLFYMYFNDNYDKDRVKIMDIYMKEGPYGYTDNQNNIDITVHKNDIVIDAGAWIGDFSAYAVKKGARVYAFEPTEESYKFLTKTALLNNQHELIPIKSGLADYENDSLLMKVPRNNAANYILPTPTSSSTLPKKLNNDTCTATDHTDVVEKISLTTIDAFVKREGLTRVDFIKADIEGAERNMLRGARETLQKFAPKLAICTYHRPDDPEVLEKSILEANPAYKIVQLRHKLFACVPET